MADENPKAVPIFEVKKKHSWKTSLIHYLEISLVIIVVLGTLVWVIVSFHFSFGNIFNNTFSFFRPKISTETVTGKQSSEAEIYQLFAEQKLFKIVSVNKTEQGDFQVTSDTGVVVFFAANKDLSEQVATLQTLLTKAKIDNKPIKKVDFRFEKIIIEN